MNLCCKIKERRFIEHKEFYKKMRELKIPREKRKEYFKGAYNYFLGLNFGEKIFYNEAFEKTIEKDLRGKEAIQEINKNIHEQIIINHYLENIKHEQPLF